MSTPATSTQITLDLYLPQVQALEKQLNSQKDLLAGPVFEELKKKDQWERSIRDQRRTVVSQFNGQNVTKAWLKMYEMLSTTALGPFLLQKPDPVKCFFNAELPGAFIFATNHYLKSNGKQMEWLVASYYPKTQDGKDFLGDEFGLLTKYRKNILVGAISTNRGQFWSDGDLTNPKVPQILSVLVKSKFSSSDPAASGVDLYTSDGGFDVSGRENQQEILTLPLIKGEIETGMRSLATGGAMVLKIFTFFTPAMITLLTFLMRQFQSFDIFKPTTSGHLNSESYFIGIGFKGTPDMNILNADPKDPNVRYVEPTSKEVLFILTRMNDLTMKQYNNIANFLAGKPLQEPSKLEIKTLPTNQQL